ncbi:MAG: hypothetical protein AAF322_06540 [Pseudomonadota bacterium]
MAADDDRQEPRRAHFSAIYEPVLPAKLIRVAQSRKIREHEVMHEIRAGAAIAEDLKPLDAAFSVSSRLRRLVGADAVKHPALALFEARDRNLRRPR